jgi:hypothetical protein
LALYRKQVTGFKKIIYSTHSPWAPHTLMTSLF